MNTIAGAVVLHVSHAWIVSCVASVGTSRRTRPVVTPDHAEDGGAVGRATATTVGNVGSPALWSSERGAYRLFPRVLVHHVRLDDAVGQRCVTAGGVLAGEGNTVIGEGALEKTDPFAFADRLLNAVAPIQKRGVGPAKLVGESLRRDALGDAAQYHHDL
jgi:hypothetical protein